MFGPISISRCGPPVLWHTLYLNILVWALWIKLQLVHVGFHFQKRRTTRIVFKLDQVKIIFGTSPSFSEALCHFLRFSCPLCLSLSPANAMPSLLYPYLLTPFPTRCPVFHCSSPPSHHSYSELVSRVGRSLQSPLRLPRQQVVDSVKVSGSMEQKFFSPRSFPLEKGKAGTHNLKD